MLDELSPRVNAFLVSLKAGDTRDRMLTPDEIECLQQYAVEVGELVRGKGSIL